MYRICKEFKFDASHQLTGLPDSHQCARLHGHTYHVQVVLAGFDEIVENDDSVGWLMDFGDLEPVKRYIDTQLDHRHLNDVFNFNPTSELLASFLFVEFRSILELRGKRNLWLQSVRVSETGSTWAEYSE